jgi:hypothetical protein
MMRSRWMALGGFFLAALIASPVWAGQPQSSIPPQPGTINYVEGQASIGSQILTDKSAGSTTLKAGQSLETQNGRAEILLTPGIFLRVDENSAVRMVNPGLADTVLSLDQGRAMLEVTEIRPQNDVRIEQNGANTRVLKSGLYEFDNDHAQIRVFSGKAEVQADDRHTDLKGGHQLALNDNPKLKTQDFDKKADEDAFYRWANLRSSYLSEANVDMASRYAGSYGWAPGLWYGAGWYWDPWFDAYTFLPGDGIFFNPFGWGFYSPFYAYGAPYFGIGGYYHHFGPGYHPPFVAGRRGPGFIGPARGGFSRGPASGFRASPGPSFHSFGGGGFGGFRGGGGFGGGGGFHGGGGFGGHR